MVGHEVELEESLIEERTDYNNFEYFERGSEWRKWDLHLHSPSSFDYKGKSVTDEDIIETLKSNDISAAVITDHHYIDVDRIKKLADLGKKQNILILPGIELRSELGGSEKVHFIGIFPIEKIDYIWTKIQGELNLQKEDIDEEEHDKVYRDLIESCNLFHKLGGITVVHAGTKAGSIEKIKNNHAYKQKQKEDLVKNPINILEIGKEENIDIYEELVFPDIGFKVPLVIGSDNHNIKTYNLKQNCWIKADLTFEGLKQIIYEPEERVKIQEVRPDEKNDYEVIDSIEFDYDEFPDSKIVLNNNLISIIGTRSTGKSILLRSIASAIDEKYVKKVCKDLDDLINPDVIVHWKNGKKDYSNNSSEDGSESKIMYVPQNFLNNKIDIEPNSFPNELISGILKSDSAYEENFSRIDIHIHSFETDINTKITALFETEKKLNELKDHQKELGSPEAVENQIKTLTEKYEEFQMEDISEEDKKLQKELIDELDGLNKELNLTKDDSSLLETFLDYLKIKNTFIDRSFIQDLTKESKDEIGLAIDVADKDYKESLVTFVVEKIENNKETIEEIQKNIESKNEVLKPLNAKFNSSDQAKEIFIKREQEKERLSSINGSLEEIKKREEKYEKILKDIFDTYNSFIENLESEEKKFVFDSPKYTNFRAEVAFKIKEFNESLDSSLHKRKFSKFKKEYGIDLYDFRYNRSNFQKDLETIIKSVLNGDLTITSKKNKKDVMKELLKDYHYINFNIKEGSDKLESMSPGKRSFALLKVLIESDNSTWPILLDQPEDDLDADSISKSLSKFLREKKRNRQIIIVSHNPNLVVGADSEQVIIANQEGSDSKNKSKRFEYISGSIENTYEDKDETCYLYRRGIKQHICDILEGGKDSFLKRHDKYNIK